MKIYGLFDGDQFTNHLLFAENDDAIVKQLIGVFAAAPVEMIGKLRVDEIGACDEKGGIAPYGYAEGEEIAPFSVYVSSVLIDYFNHTETALRRGDKDA